MDEIINEVCAKKSDETMNILTLYLEKLELLNKQERTWISRTMDWLSSPQIYISKNTRENI